MGLTLPQTTLRINKREITRIKFEKGNKHHTSGTINDTTTTILLKSMLLERKLDEYVPIILPNLKIR
jgi:hypothetical protein